MTWTEFVKTARIRAAEEADTEARLWDATMRRAAAMEAARSAGRSPASFLPARAAILEQKAENSPWLKDLAPPEVPAWLALLGWLGALLGGGWLVALGQGGEINLLALPLIGLLVWNATVVIWCLIPLKKASASAGPPEWLLRFGKRKAGGAGAPQTEAARLEAASRSRFRELVWPVLGTRFAFRFRFWLHVAAALLATGSVAGMYARGWSKEYRAVWESTLLDDEAAGRFFSVLFGPAAKITGSVVPIGQIPEMRRRIHAPAARPGDALPWIHLYAVTLGLFVVLPRGLLAALDLGQARGAGRRALKGPEWGEYARRLLALVEGQGAPALILTHGLVHDAASQDRWRQWACKHWGDVGRVEYQAIPVGGEPDFIASWKAPCPRVMLVFNMAGVPEAEVHRWLAASLLAGPKEGQGAAPLLLLALDDTDIRRRWSGFADSASRLEDRAQAWRNTLGGLSVSWV